MSDRIKNLMSVRTDCWQKDCAAYDHCETTNMSCEETRLQLIPSSGVLASHDKQAATIARLERENERLEQQLREADDAIEKCWFAHNQTTNIYMCKACGSVSFIIGDLEHKKNCTAAKAKARIEARKGKGD